MGVPVVLAGRGPMAEALRSMAARATVRTLLVEAPSDAFLRTLYRLAEVYVYPPVEDFGIMAVEAIASGTPTIVNAVGGATETISLTHGGATLDFSADRAAFETAYKTAIACDMRSASLSTMMFDRSSFLQRVDSWMGQ